MVFSFYVCSVKQNFGEMIKLFKNSCEISHDLLRISSDNSDYIKERCKMKAVQLALRECNIIRVREFFIDTTKPMTDEVFNNEELKNLFFNLKQKGVNMYEYIVTGVE